VKPLLGFASILMITASHGEASRLPQINCKVSDNVFKTYLTVESTPQRLVNLTRVRDGNMTTEQLVSPTEVCSVPVDFAKNCIVTEQSKAGSDFVSLEISCFENADSRSSWLSTFDFSFHVGSGGISHCTSSSGWNESYELISCGQR
jgi:hypothetical protein